MCWKQEWASAINNLQTAITHIERAEKKLLKRRLRNEKRLEHLKKYDKEHYYPYEINSIKALIKKNSAGEQDCKEIIKILKKQQNKLFKMIKVYGISHSKNPKRVYRLMGKFNYKKMRK